MTALLENKRDASTLAGRVSLFNSASLEAVGCFNITTNWQGDTSNSFPSNEAFYPGWGVKTKSGASLGNTTNKVSAYYFRKYGLQHDVRGALQGMNMRVDNCMKAINSQVTLSRDPEGHVHAGGLMVCGSVWVCPVCASRIGEKRRQELSRALKESGFYPVMVTVTLQHHKGESLGDLIEALNSSLTSLKRGRFWKRFGARHEVKAYVSSLEVTYSKENGWHPHKHFLFFLEGGQGVDLGAFKDEITKEYVKQIENKGRYASYYHAINVKAGDQEAGNYISKWGVVSEVVGSTDTKEARKEGSYSVWDLARMANNEAWARQAFREYARATFGKRALVYSKGAREVLGVTDEGEGEETILETVAVIERSLWNRAHFLGVIGDLLQVTETGGTIALNTFLGELQAGISPPGGTA